MLNTILRGHYKIISHLGGGGFGQTYLAEDIDLPTHPTCVVKQLKPISREPFVLETAKRLFDKEAEMLYSLGSHDRIPRLLAHFQEGEEFYLVQEFADGTDLTKEIGNGKRSPEFVVIALLQEILEILVFVHERGIVHRDIKPANLIRRKANRQIVLIDFGAVKEINGLAGDSQGNTNLTIAIGSPGYMPIEQVNGKPRFSSDIYAVGMIGIQAITGAEPRLFGEHPETAELMWREHVQGNYSPQFLDILDKMVRYDFRQRYQTAQEVLTAIAALSSINEHDLPTLISSHPNVDANNSSTIITSPQAIVQSTDIPTNTQASPSVSRFNSTNVSKLQQQKAYPWKKLAIIAGIIAAISSVVAISKTHTPTKTEVPTASITIPLPSPPPPLPIPSPNLSTASPNKSAEELLAQAILLNRNDKPQEALVKIEEALKLEPNNADAWAAKGFSLAKLDRDNEAIAAYDKALEIKPDFPFVRQSRALLERKPKPKKK
ncbi:protein kinase domain-containing protein [Pseudanabaena yagii]|uniref:non-specific serine/threonine protein kinase n=1 Tax=Pseudanabaena yagii GIHE-NHR1 TaxID=2722753 RepID=A0ABX1LRW6_9CYAN|nr:serine/threonine-protein kinase [Pseudanabaena yagii]NMF58879.1 protein kinase [Pseudanabaena yagii GIHE-NHR1]